MLGKIVLCSFVLLALTPVSFAALQEDDEIEVSPLNYDPLVESQREIFTEDNEDTCEDNILVAQKIINGTLTLTLKVSKEFQPLFGALSKCASSNDHYKCAKKAALNMLEHIKFVRARYAEKDLLFRDQIQEIINTCVPGNSPLLLQMLTYLNSN